MCSMCSSSALYAEGKDALVFLAPGFERFFKASEGKSGGKHSEMRFVCKAFIDLLWYMESFKVAGAKGGRSMIVRAMRFFWPDAEFVEKEIITFGHFCMIQLNEIQIFHAYKAGRLWTDIKWMRNDIQSPLYLRMNSLFSSPATSS